jgi:hypothetical protein
MASSLSSLPHHTTRRCSPQAFENVMNSEGLGDSRAAGSGVNVCAEFLSVYVDEHMKRLFKDMSETAIEDRLNKVITLFRFIRDKDVFEAYYKSHLTVSPCMLC